MIPYFQVNHFLLGPITIQVWGLFVAAGIIVAVSLGRKIINKLVLSEDVFLDLAVWALVSALIFARVFHVIFYEPPFYFGHPEEILKFWHGGESSLGGFFGALFAVYLFSKKRKMTLKDLLPYLDVMSLVLWLGWGIGRLGCFFIHDHVGIRSDLFLAVDFPGGARFDLGLLESLFAFIIFLVFIKTYRFFIQKRWGLVATLSWLTYGVGRFLMDFLRARDIAASDVRYLNLTPAQWGMVVVVLSLTLTLFSGRIRQVFKKRDNL